MVKMNKFAKRLRKQVKHTENGIVIGRGFGMMAEIVGVFNTVFHFSFGDCVFRAKNVVPRTNFEDIGILSDISMILIDLNQVQHIDKLLPVWTKYHPLVLIEGNDVIERDLSGVLYTNHYRCVEQQGFYHVWKKMQ
jgi:hypothetical protein